MTTIDEAIDRMLDASAAVAHAEGVYSAGARRELDEAIAAVKALTERAYARESVVAAAVMSKREHMAAATLAGIMPWALSVNMSAEGIAHHAVSVADALLLELAK